jgi:hypothetical protein
MNPIDTSHLRLVIAAQCPKLSQTAEGLLSYNIWQETDSDVLYLALAANDGGGYFSNELIPLSHIMACLATLQTKKQAFPAVRLRSAFQGKSANNASFLAAVLRHQQVLLPNADKNKLHDVSADIATWPTRLMQVGKRVLCAQGEQKATSTTKTTKPRQKKLCLRLCQKWVMKQTSLIFPTKMMSSLVP